MKYNENKATDLHIAYIGGGSKGWAWGLMSDLAIESEMSGTVTLYDIDYSAAKSNEIIGNKFNTLDDTKGKWTYKAVSTLPEALEGADFVVISILPGTFEEMESDVHAPEKYGIYQSVGDTVGPGGLIRALRTIPMYVEIAEKIKMHCPNAWVINYTNPMTLCTRTLYHVFPQIKAFGCCHEVFGTQKLLVEMLDDMLEIKDVKRQDIKVNVLGINHFTWIDKASYKGIDLLPIYNKFVDKYYEIGFNKQVKNEWFNKFFASSERVKFDLFKRYGIIAAAGDRHLAEFMPPWYLKNPQVVENWGFGITPVSWRKQLKIDLEAKCQNLVSGIDTVKINPTGEEGVQQMKALLGLGDLITNVNLPNQGQIIGLPINAVVETNAIFTRNCIQPILSGKLPSNVHSLVMRHVNNQENILESSLNKNKSLAFTTFMNDPLVNLGIYEGENLFNEMISNTSKYLGTWIK